MKQKAGIQDWNSRLFFRRGLQRGRMQPAGGRTPVHGMYPIRRQSHFLIIDQDFCSKQEVARIAIYGRFPLDITICSAIIAIA